MTVKFVKNETLVLAKNEPKIVGKGFTVSNSYVITNIQKAKHGAQMIEEEYAILENDLKVKIALWKSDVLASFANKDENLQTQVMAAPSQAPTVPQAPAAAIPPTAPIQTKYITTEELNNALKSAEDWKAQAMNLSSTIEDLKAEIIGYQKELDSAVNNCKPIQGSFAGVGVIGAISKLNVVDKLVIITLVKTESANTISVKIDNHPNLTVSSAQPFHVLDEELASLTSDAYNPNMIRIQTIQQFTADLEKLEKGLKKDITKAAEPKVDGEKPKVGRGKAATSGKLEMTAPDNDDIPPLPPLEDNDMPPVPGPDDEAAQRMAALDKRDF
jgi:hypothetical protein